MSKSKPSAILMGSKPGSVTALSILRERGWQIPYVVVTRSAGHPCVDGTEVLYQMSQPYHPQSARGVRWNDPAFGIRWPDDQPTFSEKDANYPDFEPGLVSTHP